ncbi:hypothetical protein WJX79_003747 [Trebouxia sp. C0005]
MERERHSEHRRSDRDRDRASSHRSRHDESGRFREKGRKRSRSRSRERRHARNDSRAEDSRPASKSSKRKDTDDHANDRHDKHESTVRSVSKDPDEYDPMDPDGLGLAHNAEPDAAEVEFDAGVTPEEIAMMAAMGIPFGFDSTNGKEVDDERANAGAVKAKQTRQARQYMNRRGGFNRPLPAEKTGEKVNLQ